MRRVPVAPQLHWRLLLSRCQAILAGTSQSHIMVLIGMPPMIQEVEHNVILLLAPWIFTFVNNDSLLIFFFGWKIFLRTAPMVENSVCRFPSRRAFLSRGIWQF